MQSAKMRDSIVLVLALGASRAVTLRLAPPVMQLRDAASAARASAGPPGSARSSGRVMPTRADSPSKICVQGGSLRTWSFRSPAVEQAQVILSSEGRPLDADVELWQGPGNTVSKIRVYAEDGWLRPFTATLCTPRFPSTIAIRNVGQSVFPFTADVVPGGDDHPTAECLSSCIPVQGGALRTFPFDPTVGSVQVLLMTDGRPLNARIELLQGPNNMKQIVELYAEDGRDRPFFSVIETPGPGNVVRIVNTAPMEFPMYAAVVPYSMSQERFTDAAPGGDVVIGGHEGSVGGTGRAWWE